MNIVKLILVIFFLLFTFLQNTNSTEIKNRPKIGLVLSGGGAKGFAHIGIIKAIDSLQIPIDYVAGTSMGGILGALYSIGYSGNELEQLAKQNDWEEIFSDKPDRKDLPYFQKKETGKYQLEFGLKGITPEVPSGLIFGQKISLLFSSLTFPHESVSNFDQLPTPFRCVAVDLVTGNQVVLKKGSLAKAMRATMAIPTVFSPVEWGDSLLIDGGMMNNLPVDVVKKMGAEIVIAVDVEMPLREKGQLKSVLDIMQQSSLILGIERKKENLKQVNILIQPELSDYNISDFDNDKIAEIIYHGDLAARQNLNTLVTLKDTLQLEISKPIVKKKMDQNPTIYGISVEGNEILPFGFIYRLLGIKPGEKFDTERLNQQIMAIYGLGYFESIHYAIEQVKENQVELKLFVKELRVKRVRLGIRYDNHHKLVAAISGHATNLLFPGLRLDSELQFAGLKRFRGRIYYPSRALNLPLYPIFSWDLKDISTNIFDDRGNRIARYKDRTTKVGAGLGFLISRSLNMEIQYQYEVTNIEPSIASPDPKFFPEWEDNLRQIAITLDFDTIDDVLLPSDGFLIKANYEGSFEQLNADFYYQTFNTSIDYYRTFYKRHTTRLFGFLGTSSSDVPIYKYHNLGRPNTSVGMKYDQIFGNKISLIRFDYRFQYKKDIYIKLISNFIFDLEYSFPTNVNRYHNLWGFGVGIKLLSPIGPLEFIIGYGDKSFSKPQKMQSNTYFTLGYIF